MDHREICSKETGFGNSGSADRVHRFTELARLDRPEQIFKCSTGNNLHARSGGTGRYSSKGAAVTRRNGALEGHCSRAGQFIFIGKNRRNVRRRYSIRYRSRRSRSSYFRRIKSSAREVNRAQHLSSLGSLNPKVHAVAAAATLGGNIQFFLSKIRCIAGIKIDTRISAYKLPSYVAAMKA